MDGLQLRDLLDNNLELCSYLAAYLHDNPQIMEAFESHEKNLKIANLEAQRAEIEKEIEELKPKPIKSP